MGSENLFLPAYISNAHHVGARPIREKSAEVSLLSYYIFGFVQGNVFAVSKC